MQLIKDNKYMIICYRRKCDFAFSKHILHLKINNYKLYLF